MKWKLWLALSLAISSSLSEARERSLRVDSKGREVYSAIEPRHAGRRPASFNDVANGRIIGTRLGISSEEAATQDLPLRIAPRNQELSKVEIDTRRRAWLTRFHKKYQMPDRQDFPMDAPTCVPRAIHRLDPEPTNDELYRRARQWAIRMLELAEISTPTSDRE
ncbi:MAG: hypothetical protein ACXVCH_09775 [Bdellovibrionota bacterium]